MTAPPTDTPFYRSRKAFISVLGTAAIVGLAWLKADPMAYVALGGILGVHQWQQGQVDRERAKREAGAAA